MSQDTYIIRNFRDADFDRYAEMNISAGKREWFGCQASRHTLMESLKRPDYAPEENLFLAWCGEMMAGYVNVTPERIIGRTIIDCFMHPGHDNRELAARLFKQALQHTGEINIPLAHVCEDENNLILAELLSGLGFKVVRKFINMRLDMTVFRSLKGASSAYQLSHPQAEDEASIAAIQNRCFEGSWGYNPNTASEIAHYMRLLGCSTDDVILLNDGVRVMASCWTTVSPQGKGRIHMLGVDPEYRSLGIGRATLLAGLAHLRNKRVDYVDLTVDSDNLVALSLYTSAGFRENSASLWHEKRLT